MSRSKDIFVGAALGLGVGFIAAKLMQPAPRAIASSGGQSDGRAPAARISGDMLNACEQMRPLLEQLERAGRDGTISLSDGVRIFQSADSLRGR